MLGASDPYAVVIWNHAVIGTTSTVDNCCDPTWSEHETFDLPIVETHNDTMNLSLNKGEKNDKIDNTMKVFLFDHNDVGSHAFLGCSPSIQIADMIRYCNSSRDGCTSTPRKIKLQQCNKKWSDADIPGLPER